MPQYFKHTIPRQHDPSETAEMVFTIAPKTSIVYRLSDAVPLTPTELEAFNKWHKSVNELSKILIHVKARKEKRPRRLRSWTPYENSAQSTP